MTWLTEWSILKYYILPVLAVILFLILSWDPVDDFLCGYAQNRYLLICKAAIIFIVLFIVSLLLEHPKCRIF